MEIELPTEEADGALGELKLTVPNVARLPMYYVEATDDLLGQVMTAWLAHEESLTTFSAALSWQHRLLSATVSERVVTFECGHPAQAQRVPQGIYDRRTFPQLLPPGTPTAP
ncbi:MAG: hypothetical protein ABL966_16155 [Acidimicrobiales bacterium]